MTTAMSTTPLNHRQQQFVLEYLKDLNATQAALRAGYSQKTARQIGAALLTKVVIQRAIAEAQTARKQRLELDGDLYLGILHDLCTFDLANVLDAKGNFLPLARWPARERLALAGVETIIKNAKAGDGVVDEVLKARFTDRKGNVELMLRHLGLLVDRKETGKPGEFSTLSATEKVARLEQVLERIKGKMGPQK